MAAKLNTIVPCKINMNKINMNKINGRIK